MKYVTDQIGQSVICPDRPQRIVSLVPSQTELLHNLGLAERVVGITKFCVHPATWFKTKTRVGGTKNVSLSRLAALKPDLVIANREENVKEQIEAIQQFCPVWVSEVTDLPSALQMIEQIGVVCDTAMQAHILANQIRDVWQQVPILPPYRVLYLIWKNPWMCAGTDTFIHDLLTRAGLLNCAPGKRYPILTEHDLLDLAPDLLLLSSEPYPFKEQHIKELSDMLPHARIMLTDGEMWSWYGSRLLHSANYVTELGAKLR